MMRKKRGYKREIETSLLRDYKLFAIACEGRKREPNYFKVFQYMSHRLAVDIIEEIVSENEMKVINSNKSAPKWVLDRAVRYIEKEGLSDEDDLWFVIDKDRWSVSQIREIASYCDTYSNWNIAISNPCFEVWLYFHKKPKFIKGHYPACGQLKNEISKITQGGYHPLKYIRDIYTAINNAKVNDTNSNHFLPESNETKVYQLGEVLIEFIGKNDFDSFLKNKLDDLITKEKNRKKTFKK